MSACYLYAVLSTSPELASLPRGVAHEPLRLVPVAGLVVATGLVEASPKLSVEALQRHDATVRALAAEASALVPMRFGQTVSDEAALRASVERCLPRLGRALQRAEGAEQMNLRLFADGTPEAQQAPQPPESVSGGPGTRYLLERRRQRRWATTAPSELEPLLEHLAPWILAQRVQRTQAGRMRASVYQLVSRCERGAYRQQLESGLRAHPHLNLCVSGPWPAYAFCDDIDLGGGSRT